MQRVLFISWCVLKSFCPNKCTIWYVLMPNINIPLVPITKLFPYRMKLRYLSLALRYFELTSCRKLWMDMIYLLSGPEQCQQNVRGFLAPLHFICFQWFFVVVFLVPDLLVKLLKAVDETRFTELVLNRHTKVLLEEWKKYVHNLLASLYNANTFSVFQQSDMFKSRQINKWSK